MRLLAIDAGNTRVKAGLFDDKTLVEKHAISTDAVVDADALSGWLSSTLEQLPQTMLVSSVVKGFADLAREAASPDRGVIVVSPSMPIGVTVNVPDPERVGIDRLVAAGEAYARIRRALVLVTMGTAITIDSVTGDGRFVGGTISPGLRVAARSLHTQTSLLPDVNPADVDRGSAESKPPVVTEDSIRAGVVLGAAGTIEKVMAQAWSGPDARLIVTGGDAEGVRPFLSVACDLMEDLVLHGLVSTWRRQSRGSTS